MNCRTKIQELENANDFSNYTKLLLFGVQLLRYCNDREVQRDLNRQIRSAFFDFVNFPKAFDDIQKLREVDRLNIQLYERSLARWNFFEASHFDLNKEKNMLAHNIDFVKNLNENL